MPGASVYGLNIKKNVCYTLSATAICLDLLSNDGNYAVGAIDSNFYCNPYNSLVAQFSSFSALPTASSLPNWKSSTSFDANSTASFYQWIPPYDSSFILINKTNNPVSYAPNNVVDLNNNAVTNITLQPFTSKVLIHKPSSVLPLSLLSFTGAAQPFSNLLKWVCDSRNDYKYFEVEKSSDGVHFSSIGNVIAGNNGSMKSYTFEDENLSKDINYYRLQMVDVGMKKTFSNIVQIKNRRETERSFSIFPNPGSGRFLIKSQEPISCVNVFDNKGQKVMEFLQKNISLIDIQSLTNGTYMLEVFIGNKKYQTTISKISK